MHRGPGQLGIGSGAPCQAYTVEKYGTYQFSGLADTVQQSLYQAPLEWPTLSMGALSELVGASFLQLLVDALHICSGPLAASLSFLQPANAKAQQQHKQHPDVRDAPWQASLENLVKTFRTPTLGLCCKLRSIK
jgi:hypothetical protein